MRWFPLTLGVAACQPEEKILIDTDFGDADTDTDGDTDADGDSDADTDTEPGAGVDHCGVIDRDTTWTAADNPHRISCDVEVQVATLTIEAGVEVYVASEKGLYVASDDLAASLKVNGTEALPVVFRQASGSAAGYWDSFSIEADAYDVELHHLQLIGGGSTSRAAFWVDSVEVLVDGLLVQDSGQSGIEFEGTGRFAASSRAVRVTGSAEEPVLIEADAAHTVPEEDSDYTGNGVDLIRVDAGTVDEPVEWGDVGVPYAFDGDVRFEGAAGAPAVLTVLAGARLSFDDGGGLYFSQYDGASGLVVEGTPDDPVVFTALAAPIPGAWDGIVIRAGADPDALSIRNARIEWAGDNSANGALVLDDVEAEIENVEIIGSSSDGVRLLDGAAFAPGSSGLSVTESDRPITLPAASLGSLLAVGPTLSGNTNDFVFLTGDEDVTASATWSALDIPYWVTESLHLEGTAISPAVVTIGPGATFYMEDDVAVYVAKDGGAAALRVAGTASEPVVFTAAESLSRGAWAGIGIYDAAVDAETVLEHLEVWYGGGVNLQGNVHLVACNPTLDHVALYSSADYGLYLTDDAAPTLGTMTYGDNARGDTN